MKRIGQFASRISAKLEPLAAVGLGGALGALARTLVIAAIPNGLAAVLVCNIAGSFLLAAAESFRGKVREDFENMLSAGFCGGLSIFATFSKDSVAILSNAEYALFFANLFGNFTLCVLAVFAAKAAIKNIRRSAKERGRR
ncbi:MAG: CrcB family protein [Opitutales bacterium]|nr:CrcB family protein [Opitutales bacterium]